MPFKHRTWQEKLTIVDDTMRAISGLSDPEELITKYYDGIGKLIPSNDYMSLSRRGCQKPEYVVTRSSRMEDINPFLHFDKLPRFSGGLIGEFMWGNQPMIIEDLPSRLKPDEPAMHFLKDFQTLIALPQYEDGEAMNATCMMLPKGHEFDLSLIPTLHWQASLFGRGVRNQVLRNQLQTAVTSLDREMQVVGQIQRQLLPRDLPAIPGGIDVATHYVTSARAGGDYYDFFPLENNCWGLFIADVSGHGTPAAVLMAITHALAHAQPGKHTPPAQLLAYLNHQLTRTYIQAGSFITAFYAVLDPAKKTLTYARAGHNPPRLVRDGKVHALEATGALPMGIETPQEFEEVTVSIQRGDLLVLYTDGITEAMSGTHELFGVDRLDRVLLSCTSATAQEIIGCIKESVDQFTNGTPARDDQTLIVLQSQ
jgi:sigma-B regulation protein RsbU (phosphoserine phosphatase)